jgi:hypothetical protein
MASNTTWHGAYEERVNMARWERSEHPRMERSMDTKTTLFQTYLQTTKVSHPKSFGLTDAGRCMGYADATTLLPLG